MGETFAVLAGGGTAGHVIPALAIAEALVDAGHPRSSVRFAGARTGMEARLVPEAGFAVELLDVRNFPRELSVRNLVAAFRQVTALVAAVRRLGWWRPRVVVSLGGFASMPWVLAARLRRIPVVVVSYDAKPGWASKLEARLAAASAVAFPEVDLPRARVTGTPLRREILAVDRARDRFEARRALGLPAESFVVLAVGGSLGSGRINEAVRDLVAACADDATLAVDHVIGARNAAAFVPPPTRGCTHLVVPFEDRMPLAYAAADLAVARAGATTVAELAAVGLPSILVPWPLAAEDHQTANAQWLARAGGAVVVRDDELTGDRLLQEVNGLRADPARLAAMGAAARAVSRPDAAAAVAALVEEVAAR